MRKTIRFSACVLVCLFASFPVASQEYVGAERCKDCHEFEYMKWAQGPHAKAESQLGPAELKDPKCNTCHTMIPGKSEKRFGNIQCERCHGPAQYYHHEYVMKDKELSKAVGLIMPTGAHCQQCHTEGAPSIKPFNFEEMWSRIDHGSGAREAWEKARRVPSSDK